MQSSFSSNAVHEYEVDFLNTAQDRPAASLLLSLPPKDDRIHVCGCALYCSFRCSALESSDPRSVGRSVGRWKRFLLQRGSLLGYAANADTTIDKKRPACRLSHRLSSSPSLVNAKTELPEPFRVSHPGGADAHHARLTFHWTTACVGSCCS